MFSFKDTHREMSTSNKIPAFQDYEYGHLGRWYIKTTLYNRLLNWKTIFEKIKQLLAKPRSLWLVHFVLTILFVLKLASDMAVSYGNDAFSILVLSTKKRYFSFFMKVFVFQKILLKLKYWQLSKFPLIVT